jgi:hypothetical protein
MIKPGKSRGPAFKVLARGAPRCSSSDLSTGPSPWSRRAQTIPDLHRIELYIEPWNTSSIRVAEAAGCQREGLLRSHQEIGGTRRDMLLYAMTRG